MQRSEAISILGIQEEEEVYDAFEMHLFKIRDFIYKNPILPKLFEAKKKRVISYHKAFSVLAEEDVYFPMDWETANSIQAELIEAKDLFSLIKIYEKALAQAKQYLGLSLHPISLLEGIDQLIKIQLSWEEKLRKEFTALLPTLNIEVLSDVKKSNRLDTQELRKELKQLVGVEEDQLSYSKLIELFIKMNTEFVIKCPQMSKELYKTLVLQ